jgi:Tol biopolymer transport system component
LIWFDRRGMPLGNLGSGSFYAPSLSPDEKTVAAARVDPETQTPDLWLMDTARGVSPRFTFDPREDLFPVWSPNGERIVFAAQSPGTPPNLFQKLVSATSGEEQLLKSRFNSQPTDWSRDGKFVVYARRDPHTQWDLWLMPMSPEADRTEQPYLQSNANEHLAQFSPDGMWIAYTSDESGTNEVYVQTFPKLGTREQISTSGGSQPRWSADGRDLFYIAPDGRLMAVSVKPGQRFEATAPTALFKTRIADLFGAENTGYITNYTVSRDGKRFLVSTVVDESNAVPATTIFINWLSRLPQR